MENNENKNLDPASESGKDAERNPKEELKAKKAAKKEKRKAKKAAKKEAFKALSAKGKAFYFGWRFAAAILIAIIICKLWNIISVPIQVAYVNKLVASLEAMEVSEEQLLEGAPIDQALSEKVDGMKKYGPDDTWAIYVYMCGSDLEGGTMDNLSEFSKILLSYYSDEIDNKKWDDYETLLKDYIDDLTEQGMDVPDYMYLNTPMSPSVSEEQPEAEPELAGCATNDIKEMTNAELSDKIKIIIQTGGSPAWKLTEANPNRSQRFIADKDGLRLLEDNHFVNMGEAETLSDFFRFCEKTAPADHKIAVLWDHGAGAFGFAADRLYGGDSLTLKEMNQAFADVYPNNPADPAFEVIGFDACLMASLEVAESLYGYGKYLAASEEVEPGQGWDYTVWLNALSKDLALNGAQVGKEIADSFIDSYAEMNVRYEQLGLNFEVTFSILDINEMHKIYGQYCDLADKMLKDSIDDMSSLVTLGRAADQTVRFGGSAYDIFNMIDFVNMIENLKDAYPVETSAILDSIDKAVLYNRASKSMIGSKGISVYFPTKITANFGSLMSYLDYINNICLDDGIRALYYYKASGCLNSEMQAYADSLGYGKASKLDNSALRTLQYGDAAIDADKFSMTLPKESESLIQTKTFYLAELHDDYTIDYGEDGFVKTEDGKLSSTFDGRWLSMDGNVLPLERVGAEIGATRYRTKVQHNGTDSYMMLAVDEASGVVRIMGLYDMYGDDEAVAKRNTKNVAVGDKLKVIYDKDDFESGGGTEIYGPEFTYKANTKISYEKIKDGSYLAVFVMHDMRGDKFYSPIVQYEIKGGKIASIAPNKDFFADASE